jgi:YaaC-like Protein
VDRDTWNSLSQFQTFDLVQRRFKRRYGLDLNADRTWEITACFVQAQEYFSNAERSAEPVRPLLLYYGALALSRGLILFLKSDAREATLSPRHGLTAVDWQQTLSRGIANVLELEVRCGDGTYSELAAATENHIVTTTPVQGGTVQIAGLRPPLGESSSGSIKFDDVLSRVPELRDAYRDVTERTPKVLHGVIIDTASAQVIRIAQHPVLGLTTAGEIRLMLGVPPEVEIGGSPGDQMFSVPNLAYRLPPVFPMSDLSGRPIMEDFDQHAGSIIAPWPNGGYLSPLLRCFVASYFLGMLVRYFPSRWMSLIRNDKGDAAVPLLRAATDHIERAFPRLALRALDQTG